jgi:purine-nucleoside phosphorylase
MGDNPLIGPNDEAMGPRFPDMSQPFCPRLRQFARETALEARIRLHEGVLVGVAGPNLETRAEYRAFRMLGADLVTMSTIPEVIVANHAGMRVVALSTVTDNCLPDALKPADIREIIAVAQAAEPRLETLVLGILARMGH